MYSYMYILSPVKDRAEITERGHQTFIDIPAAKNVVLYENLRYASVFIVAPLCLFLFAAFGGFSTESLWWFLFNISLSVVLLYSWLISIRMGAWRQAGRERIIVDPQQITIRFDYDPWNRKAVYHFQHIQSIDIDIRPPAADLLVDGFQRYGVDRLRISRVWKYTTLRFEYQGKTVRFGREITRADAEMIREAINYRLNII
ncbi:MAG: hypothetical protein JXJ17_00180 [Anaerolineae bacterium]|nr:hypothetical protein [Anaerolineae bacterium]